LSSHTPTHQGSQQTTDYKPVDLTSISHIRQAFIAEMTTELSTDAIVSQPNTQTRYADNIPLSKWTQIESSSDSSQSTPLNPLNSLPPSTPHSPREIPLPRLLKVRTTGDHLQQLHNQSGRPFLNANRGHLANRKLSFSGDYGLDELRAPPILPDRERRKSLEHALSHQPDLPPKSFRHRLRDDLVVGCWITFFSIWGSLARIGISTLSEYPGQPVFRLIWSQFVGCTIMGFLLQDKTLFPKEDRYVPLYIGLTTGFCGSITSFSSFIWNSFQALANLDPYFERGWGRNVLALSSQVIITLCVSISALRFGAHCSQVTRHMLPSLRDVPKVTLYLDTLGVTLGVTGWIAAGLMTGLISKWGKELFTALLAPAGTGIT
jgi:fluoride ion exporter CrcB/FEX